MAPKPTASTAEPISDQILNRFPGDIFILDAGTLEILQASGGAAGRLGLDPEEVRGRTWDSLTPNTSRDAWFGLLQPLLNRKQAAAVLETRLTGRGGKPHASQLRFHYFPDTRPPVLVAFNHDQFPEKTDFETIVSLSSRLEAENRILKSEIREMFGKDLIGESPALEKVKEQIALVADTDAPVLIQGETGTGKELIARIIHESSLRRNAPLVKVNCPAIPHDLFESEFFGHIKGSFTGAVRDRVGRFQLAHKGTLFLDEITEIPLDLQGKLLRVLQENQFERVGESETQFTDVRILAASNRDLMQEIEAGRFREDLYYRLNVFHIQVPPLRERAEDVKRMGTYFLNKFCEKYKLPPIRPAREDWDRLKQYPWPGNVREMENMMERLVILCRKQTAGIGRILDELLLPGQNHKPAPATGAAVASEEDQKELTKSNILKALEQTNWKISGPRGAARLLGLKDSTLWHRMKKLGIEKPE